MQWDDGPVVQWDNGEPVEWASSHYVTFDDDVARDAAEADPIGFVNALPGRVILDEIQRVPSIFTALKMAIDRERIPGRFC